MDAVDFKLVIGNMIFFPFRDWSLRGSLSMSSSVKGGLTSDDTEVRDHY